MWQKTEAREKGADDLHRNKKQDDRIRSNHIGNCVKYRLNIPIKWQSLSNWTLLEEE